MQKFYSIAHMYIIHQVRVMLQYRRAVLYIQSDDVYSAHVMVTQKIIGLQSVQKQKLAYTMYKHHLNCWGDQSGEVPYIIADFSLIIWCLEEL